MKISAITKYTTKNGNEMLELHGLNKKHFIAVQEEGGVVEGLDRRQWVVFAVKQTPSSTRERVH